MDRLRTNFLFLLFVTLCAGCASKPVVDERWLTQNCRPFPSFHADACSIFTNCEDVNGRRDSYCKCRYEDGGTYIGELEGGERHGYGIYQWPNGAQYSGWWHQGGKLCGIERSSSELVVIQRGQITAREPISSGTGDAVLGALILGGVAYGLSQMDSYPAPTSSKGDYQWDWDAFYRDGRLVWACRGVQTGRFAELERCRGKPKNDSRWPTKREW